MIINKALAVTSTVGLKNTEQKFLHFAAKNTRKMILQVIGSLDGTKEIYLILKVTTGIVPAC